jgi:hypothetical protein
LSKFSILSAKIDYLIDYAKKQFSTSKGLHLNSTDWKSFITVGTPLFYSFLINGTIKWHTTSAISGERYDQLIKLSDFKKLEAPILLMFLTNVPDADISRFIAEFFSSTEAKIYCPCPSFLFYGSAYNLTQIKSKYGAGESRPPIEKDPDQKNLVCKHLWLLLQSYPAQINKFSTSLIPYYKRYFGLTSPTGVERTRKQLGEKGVRRVIEQATIDLNKIKDNDLTNIYSNLVKGRIDKVLNTEINTQQKQNYENIEKANPQKEKLELENNPGNNTDNTETQQENENLEQAKENAQVKEKEKKPEDMTTREKDEIIQRKNEETGNKAGENLNPMELSAKIKGNTAITGTKRYYKNKINKNIKEIIIKPSDLDEFLK